MIQCSGGTKSEGRAGGKCVFFLNVEVDAVIFAIGKSLAANCDNR